MLRSSVVERHPSWQNSPLLPDLMSVCNTYSPGCSFIILALMSRAPISLRSFQVATTSQRSIRGAIALLMAQPTYAYHALIKVGSADPFLLLL
jgi:hypothetical protein